MGRGFGDVKLPTARARAAAASVLVATAIGIQSCGAKSGLALGERGPVDGGRVGTTDAGGGVGGAGGAGGVSIADGGSVDACRRLEAEAALAPLDVFLMLDSSGSMLNATPRGPSKWEEVQGALDRFFSDVDSGGVGIALSFFPTLVEGVPETCRSDGDCGAPGACRHFGVCTPSLGAVCVVDADCAVAGNPTDRCERVGRCATSPDVPCLIDQPELSCDPGTSCVELGLCANLASCDVASYGSPAVALRTLPSARESLVSELASMKIVVPKPTLPALVGVLDSARAFARENPGHKVVALLATDGLPTVCGAADFSTGSVAPAVDEVAAVAAGGVADGIQTFVVGVLSADDISTPEQNLDRIARAGGTGAAFVVSEGGRVTAEFLAAMVEVRERALSCEFSIPPAVLESDLSRLEVRIPDVGPVDRVGGVDSCDPGLGGYAFDRPLGGGRQPGRVILCPASCGRFPSGIERIVELAVDCR